MQIQRPSDRLIMLPGLGVQVIAALADDSVPPEDALLLETGDNLLLETGDDLLLE